MDCPYPDPKSEEIANCLKGRNVNVCCLQETNWTEVQAKQMGHGYKLFYIGDSNHRNGVVVKRWKNFEKLLDECRHHDEFTQYSPVEGPVGKMTVTEVHQQLKRIKRISQSDRMAYQSNPFQLLVILVSISLSACWTAAWPVKSCSMNGDREQIRQSTRIKVTTWTVQNTEELNYCSTVSNSTRAEEKLNSDQLYQSVQTNTDSVQAQEWLMPSSTPEY